MVKRTALVLAGHGSHLSPETAGVVWQQVDILRRSGVADEVSAAFWKEAPSFHDVFRTLTADDITIVPMFTARGYFTQTVIPAEMGLAGLYTERDGRLIRYAGILGGLPLIDDFAELRVRSCLEAIGDTVSPDQVAAAVIGHSTKLNPESRRATEAQAESVREAGIVGEVVAVFLDDSPEIAEIYQLTAAPIIIAVPYFLTTGSHVSIDIPARLGLQPGQTVGQIQGRTVYYTPPIGSDQPLSDFVLGLAVLVGMPHKRSHVSLKDWRSFPQAGRQLLIDTVRAAQTFAFGELELTPYNVRVVGEAGVSLVEMETPGQLRAAVRNVPFCPLPTARNLPRGWQVQLRRQEQLYAVVETIYPGAVAEWAAYQTGTLNVESLETTVARQTGMFRALKDLSATERSSAVDAVCGGCVRHPTWHYGESPEGAIPCAAPCNWWMSHVLKAMKARNMENGEA